ncbi:hypothetical protein [Azospirillum endophyticum]
MALVPPAFATERPTSRCICGSWFVGRTNNVTQPEAGCNR